MKRTWIICVATFLLWASLAGAAAPPVKQDYVKIQMRGTLFVEKKPTHINPDNWGEGPWNDISPPLIQIGEGMQRVLYSVRYDQKLEAMAKKLDGKKVIIQGDLRVSAGFVPIRGADRKVVIFRVIRIRSLVADE
jgi:hypothetical protein